ncbi:EAL domain-containing protein [Wenzhouxiangella sp. XN24]|uniref:EAL domain-containing protein n=1 Tax=Wenzhouxiangella sp. XN24 TaxID=2713569 RepID=UPI0013ED4F62|nr:EAL domain-containing protein [Wenzhouxiangella sp. XN24]
MDLLRASSSRGLSLDGIIESGTTVDPDRVASEVLDLFLADHDLRVIPVIDQGRPVGLVNRQSMVEMFSRPFRRDLFGRREIRHLMDPDPIIVHATTDIDDLAQTLVAAGLQQMLDGFLVVGADGSYAGIGNAQTLLSEMTKRKEAHLYQMAHYDALTGLPNRILFRDRLTMALEQASRSLAQVAVVFLDIDHFKRINDTLGHPAGDDLLRTIAHRLQSSVRGCDTLARMGGDEFTLVLTGLTGSTDAAVVIRKLRARLSEPMALAGRQTMVTASIGIAMYPGDGREMDDLVRKADIALYASKQAGRDTYHFFDKTHQRFDDSRLYLEEELRVAISQHRVQPVFQALVSASDGRVVGMEALARWRHPEMGMIPPSTFVTLAEDAGLIRALGLSMNRAASLAAANDPDTAGLRLSLNVSALEIRADDFVSNLLQQLEEVGLPPAQVQLELTERLFLDPSQKLLAKLEELRGKGIKIAIDDFGIGATSLHLLHKLPIDVLKIDRVFIHGLEEDDRIGTLVRAIIEMGHSLGLEIVAEGVETATQAQRLRGYGCDYLQGYLFCKPMAPPRFRAWLRRGEPLSQAAG